MLSANVDANVDGELFCYMATISNRGGKAHTIIVNYLSGDVR